MTLIIIPFFCEIGKKIQLSKTVLSAGIKGNLTDSGEILGIGYYLSISTVISNMHTLNFEMSL